jgi:hypothetical protein
MSDAMIVVKANRPLRFFAIGMATLVIVAHFVGQINLTEDWLFWILLAMSANAIQATFTGFCPMFKNANGECVACGVACDAPSCQTTSTPESKETR